MERDSRIVDQREVLARLKGISAQEAYVRAANSDAREQLARGEFLVGASDNVINADLQTRLKAITNSVGARSRAAQSLPSKVDGAIKYNGSRIEIYGSIQSIHRAIHAIENAKPYLFISGAVIKLLPPIQGGAPKEPIIQAQLDIFGAIQPQGTEP